MTEEEIKEGDIVEIDYVEEYTKEHINEGKALVIWKGFNCQPLVRKLDTKATIWTCYEHIVKVVGHIDIEDYIDKALGQEPKAGHWIDTGSGQECSECGEIQHGYDNFRYFCAYCGATMIEPQESNDTEKLKPCINYEEDCEAWAGCPCVYYNAESEE